MFNKRQLALLFACAFAFSSYASAASITFTNADRTIPLEVGSVVLIHPDGNLSAKCALTNGVCAGLTGAVSWPAPVAAPVPAPTPVPAPPPVNLSGCKIVGPMIAPPGLSRISKTWIQAWSAPNGSAIARFPSSIGSPVPLGSEKGSYTAISFVPTANLDVQIQWDMAQASRMIGYGSPRPTNRGMFVGISPCPGDLRPANEYSTEPFERPTCRLFDVLGGLNYSTRPAANPEAQCKLVAGQTYYINVAPIDTADGLTLPEDTCNNSLSGCDVQAIHR